MTKINNRQGGNEKGWYNVAWGFLKLVSASGKPNAGRKMRLQLFYPPRTSHALQDSSFEAAHDWWLNHPRIRYPATLYVSVKAVLAPTEMAASSRSMFATQPEESGQSFNELNRSLEQSEADRKSAHDEDLESMKFWSRLPGQTCKIPNAPFLRFWSGSEGAFTVQFSNRGTRLAAACRHESTYPIFLYGIPSGNDLGSITGHQQLVYDLQWSKTDRYLLSASADGTAQVWDVDHKEKPVHTLPHPCYVYTASFHPASQYLIATGGYDTVLRVWNIASTSSILSQELDGHKAIINSIIFDQTGLVMFSADGAGVIICWNCPVPQRGRKTAKTNWSLQSRIADRDLTGICINSLRLHPQNNKILIHCRDSSVRILDTRIHSLKRFTGLLNQRQLLRSAITPCGTLIFSGSEDGYVYVWNTDTGDQVAIYNELGYTNAVHAVVYHPHDHMVAFCSYAPNQSILVYRFNSKVAALEAGFKQEGQMEAGVTEEDAGFSNLPSQIEASKTAVKLEKIKHKLDSVLADSLNLNANTILPSHPRNQDGQIITPIKTPHGASQSADGSYGPLSTWGSTFDTTTQMESRLAPSFMSPHASPEARVMAQQYARSGRMDADMSGSWRPGVAAVGGSPYRNPLGIPPDVSISMGEDGKQKVNVTPATGSETQTVVVVMFDYQANRSDELTIARGEVIHVLFKDSPNWWFGERTSDKKQGYFPSNYVEEQVLTASLKQSGTKAPVFGVPEVATPKKVHALKMPSGRLQFYSQSESEGDDDRGIHSRFRRPAPKTSIPSVGANLEALNASLESTQPKSILQKASPRARTPESSVKGVSFADEKKPVSENVKQNLIETVQSAMKSSGVATESDPTPEVTPKPSPRQLPTPSPRQPRSKPKPQPKPKSRSASQRKSGNREESSFMETPEATSAETPSVSTPSFLKSVQAMMKQSEDDSLFSQSVVGGYDISTPASKFQVPSGPIHSTAVKKLQRDPVENDEGSYKSGGVGSVVRKARALPKLADEETIPMIEIKGSKRGKSSPRGQSNPAFEKSL